MAKKPRWHKNEFAPKNPEKYVGTFPIIYRSSWENAFMQKCDSHPNIIKWASESIKIPYYNPFYRKVTIYIPDFFIQYVDKTGQVKAEIIEIKPRNQALESMAKGRTNKAMLAINKLKWAAATKWAKQHGVGFRVMTEADMFYT